METVVFFFNQKTSYEWRISDCSSDVCSSDLIAEIGLKRPITVTARQGEDGLVHDLVCGQGRLEAFRVLAQTEVPALIVAADAEDCLVSSLVATYARRQHPAVDLLQDIVGMRERGYSDKAIAEDPKNHREGKGVADQL